MPEMLDAFRYRLFAIPERGSAERVLAEQSDCTVLVDVKLWR